MSADLHLVTNTPTIDEITDHIFTENTQVGEVLLYRDRKFPGWVCSAYRRDLGATILYRREADTPLAAAIAVREAFTTRRLNRESHTS